MNLTELIEHPELMDRETLYDLRSLIALHPYYQTARLLMLQNLYLLHDPTFDDELRRAAIYITDRKLLFQLIEAAHYKLRNTPGKDNKPAEKSHSSGSRTAELIDTFLESLPNEETEPKKKGRKPTPADAAVDYVAYLIESEMDNDAADEPTPLLKGHNLIDDFINRDGGRFVLPEDPEPAPTPVEEDSNVTNDDGGVYTEMMAQIYVRQGRYSQALDIIRRLNLDNPKKNIYFADQIRFLEKLVKNETAAKKNETQKNKQK